jgi:hypothetical protein
VFSIYAAARSALAASLARIVRSDFCSSMCARAHLVHMICTQTCTPLVLAA